MRLDVYIHRVFPRDGLLELVRQVFVVVTSLERKVASIMTTVEQWNERFTRIDNATTQIGQGIRVLVDRVRAGGMSDAEEAEALNQIEVRAAALEQIAHDVNNPVPAEPPPVP